MSASPYARFLGGLEQKATDFEEGRTVLEGNPGGFEVR